MTLSLDRLPYDVLFNIAGRLSFSDVIHLSLTCRQLYQHRNESTLCRKTVENHAPFTKEARLAATGQISYRQAFERIYSRRGAFATATPSSACVIDYGSSFLYRQNVLCYMSHGNIRVRSILDKSLDIVIETRPMVAWLSTNQFGNSGIQPEVNLLHYSDGIVSLHFDYSESELPPQWRDDEHWLIYVELQKFNPVTGAGVNIIKPPVGASKLFVRNNGTYYFYGTHTGLGAHGHHEWKIHSHSLAEDDPSPPNNPPLQLDEFVGSDLGSTVAFEIHEDHFYAVSNQTSFVVEEVDWTSFYHCIRFPLHRPVEEAVQVNTRVYRRQHAEGPINDSWTDLSLQVDERTNKLQIVEARREWRNGGSKQERTFYTREVTFPVVRPSARRRQTASAAVAMPSASQLSASDTPEDDNDNNNGLADEEEEEGDDDEDDDDTAELDDDVDDATINGESSSHHHHHHHHHHPLLLPSDDLLVSTLGSGNNPHYAPVEERLPRSYHPERRHDDSLAVPSQVFILARTKLRAYNLSCSAFLDLVEDEACCPAAAAVGGPPCLRLRIGARRRQAYLPLELCRANDGGGGSGGSEGKGKGRAAPAALVDDMEIAAALPPYEDRFVYPPIKLWPPVGEARYGGYKGAATAAAGAGEAKKALCAEKLHGILNAPLTPPPAVVVPVPVSDSVSEPLPDGSSSTAAAAAAAAVACEKDEVVTSPMASSFSQLSFDSQASTAGSAATAATSTYAAPPPPTDILAVADERSVVFLRRPKYGSGERSGPIVLVSFDRGIDAEELAYTARAERKDSGIALGVDDTSVAGEEGLKGVRVKSNEMVWKRDECWESGCACVRKMVWGTA